MDIFLQVGLKLETFIGNKDSLINTQVNFCLDTRSTCLLFVYGWFYKWTEETLFLDYVS